MGVFDKREYVEKYEEWFKNNPKTFESELNALREVLPCGTGFEIGIGTGTFAEQLGIKMGCDVSKEMLKSAEKKGLIVYEKGGHELPFHNGYFDFIAMITTVCFLDNPEEVFRESYRVTKYKGKLIIGFIPFESILGRVYNKKGKRSHFYRDAEFLSVEKMKSMISSSGFVIDDSRQVLFGDIKLMDSVQQPKKGYDKGSFVVFKASKT